MSAMLRSYLMAWFFLLGISLGSLANLMVHALTGGGWGLTVRPALVGAARLVPALAILFLPVAFGVAIVYPWNAAPGWWLNAPFFIARSVTYLAVWSVLAVAFLRADAATAARALGASPAARRIAAGGLVVYALTMSLAAVDWIASLTPQWHSSGFGLLVIAGQMLGGAAFGIAVAAWRSRHGPSPRSDLAPARFHDLGNLLLMYVLVWAYLAYTQFLIIWSENLPREIAWYVPRVQTSWAALGIFLVTFHFALPLAILLSRNAKRASVALGTIAAALLAAHLGEALWLVMPAFRPRGFLVTWSDVAAFAVLGAAWAWQWRRSVARAAAAMEPAHG